jgi:hypothetical protein
MLFSNLNMAEGSDLHPLRQVSSHPQRTDYGKAQFGAPGLQKGELLNLLPALPLRLLQLLLGVGHCIRQALGVLLGRISGLARLRLVSLEKGNPQSEVLYFPMSRGQHCSALYLHSRHPLPSLPLCLGGLGLLHRSLCSMHRLDTGNLHSNGDLPRLDLLLWLVRANNTPG